MCMSVAFVERGESASETGFTEARWAVGLRLSVLSVIWILAGAAGLRADAEVESFESARAPELVIRGGESEGAERILDLGELVAGDELRFRIRWESAEGEAPETVESVHSSCGCLAVDFRPEVILHDAPVVYTGVIKASAHVLRPEALSRSLGFVTDRRKVSVSVVAHVSPRQEFSPAPAHFSLDEEMAMATASREIPAGVVVESVEIDPIWRERGLAARVLNDTDGARLELQVDAPLMKEHCLRVTKRWPWRETIRAGLRMAPAYPGDRPAPPAPFLIELEYSGPVRTRPRSLDFGLVRPGEEAVIEAVIEGDVRWLGDLEVQTPSDVRAVLGAPTEGGSPFLRLTKTGEPERATGGDPFLREEIEIRYGGGHSLKIPLHYILRGNSKPTK